MRKKACPTYDKPENEDVFYTDSLLFVNMYTVQFFVLVQFFPFCPLQLYCTLSQSIYLICRRNIVDLAHPVNAWKELNAYEILEIYTCRAFFFKTALTGNNRHVKTFQHPSSSLVMKKRCLSTDPWPSIGKKVSTVWIRQLVIFFFSELKTQCFYRSYLIF